MLQAFIDDSGSDTGDKRLFLAGYIHHIDGWVDFSSDWKLVLQEPPSLSCLHMVESFRGWSPEDRHRKLVRLASVIEKYKPLSIESSISTKDFKELLQPHAPYDLRSAYGYCFDAIVIKSAQLLKESSLQGPLDFVFDEQGKVGADAALFYQFVKQLQEQSIRGLLGDTPIFRDDKDFPQLQAADMLAWHRRKLREPNCTDQHRLIAESIIFKHAVVDVSRETLLSLAHVFSKVPGIEAVRDKNGSIKKQVANIVARVPPEQLVPVMEAIQRRGRGLLRLKKFLEWACLGRIWKKIAKRKKTHRS